MMNRYKKGELVTINGTGKLYGKKYSNVIGIVKEKDYYFNQYYVEVTFDQNDWFKESDITRIFTKEQKKTNRYKVCLAIKDDGYEYIRRKMSEETEKTIDLFAQADLFQTYQADGNTYLLILWKDTYWPETNFTVKVIEKSLPKLRKQNIAYQYIKIGITNGNERELKINEFIKNDNNVNIFEILTNIKIKKIGGIV